MAEIANNPLADGSIWVPNGVNPALFEQLELPGDVTVRQYEARTPEGFRKELLSDVPNVGYVITRRCLGNFAVSKHMELRTGHLTENGMRQRAVAAYDSLALHLIHGHIEPEHPGPCGCPLHGVRTPINAWITGTVLIDPQSLVEAARAGSDGESPIATMPARSSPGEFNDRTRQSGTRRFGRTAGFPVLQAYIAAYSGKNEVWPPVEGR